jgi:hypothetical protein
MCLGRIFGPYWLFPAAAIVVLSERPGNGWKARIHRLKGRVCCPLGKHRRSPALSVSALDGVKTPWHVSGAFTYTDERTGTDDGLPARCEKQAMNILTD